MYLLIALAVYVLGAVGTAVYIFRTTTINPYQDGGAIIAAGLVLVVAVVVWPIFVVFRIYDNIKYKDPSNTGNQ